MTVRMVFTVKRPMGYYCGTLRIGCRRSNHDTLSYGTSEQLPIVPGAIFEAQEVTPFQIDLLPKNWVVRGKSLNRLSKSSSGEVATRQILRHPSHWAHLATRMTLAQLRWC